MSDDGFIHALSSFSGYSKQSPAVQDLERTLELQVKLAEQYTKGLDEYSRAAQEDRRMIDELQQKQVQKMIETTRLPVYDRESADHLIRICLTELLRIEWELASEVEIAKGSADVDKSNMDNIRLEEAKVQLVSMESRYAGMEEKLRNAKEGFSKNSVSKSELADTQIQLDLARADLRLAQLALKKTEVAAKAQLDHAAIEAARKIRMLEKRKSVVSEQLDRLGTQRRELEAVMNTQTHLEMNREETRELQRQRLELQLKLGQSKNRMRLLKELFDQPKSDNSSEPTTNK